MTPAEHARDNAFGVDAPLDRLFMALIFLRTGALPEGFDESWLDEIPRDLQAERAKHSGEER